MLFLAAPLALAHGTLVFRGTPVGNHCSTRLPIPMTLRKWHNSSFMFQGIYIFSNPRLQQCFIFVLLHTYCVISVFYATPSWRNRPKSIFKFDNWRQPLTPPCGTIMFLLYNEFDSIWQIKSSEFFLLFWTFQRFIDSSPPSASDNECSYWLRNLTWKLGVRVKAEFPPPCLVVMYRNVIIELKQTFYFFFLSSTFSPTTKRAC